jgi:hypothetical protein
MKSPKRPGPDFLLFAAAAVITAVSAAPASAVPAFARQTGQQCAACHNGFPELTPYGRLFKLNAYTFGGGTTPNIPFSMMTVGSFTHTATGQTGGAAPDFGPNDNFALDQTSLFAAGRFAPNFGGFIQMTYNGIGKTLSWDNTDIRYARTFDMFAAETVWGISLNNNPTVQDVWNTVPAWRFPYTASGLAPVPGGGTMIEGMFAQQVAGLTTYALWNRNAYLEFGGYASLSPRSLSTAGIDPGPTSSIKGIAPYWRLALTNDWRHNSAELGLFGMSANIVPQRIDGFGTDQLTDFGVDGQYQYLTDPHSISLQASAIFENQILGASASSAFGLAANTHNTVASYHAKATYFYEQTYGISAGAFRIAGTPDALLYAANPGNAPNSDGFVGEADYIPFNSGGPGFWPWLNMKIGVQYTYYTKFNGATGSAATGNNTLFAFVWLAF